MTSMNGCVSTAMQDDHRHTSSLSPLTAAALALALTLPVGCSLRDREGSPSPEEPAKVEPVAIRFHLGTTTEREGYRKASDEQGRPLYIAGDPVLTERDIVSATALHSDRRSLVLLVFAPAASNDLRRLTGDHLGGRLAIFVDDDLVMSPLLRAPIAGGKVVLDAGFSRERANQIARAISGH